MLTRKAIHIQVSEDAHASFRKLCIDHKVTMQEIIEFFVLGVLDEKPEMVGILESVSKAKKSKTVKRVSAVEHDAIYNAISGGD
jgi:hypothetical protein